LSESTRLRCIEEKLLSNSEAYEILKNTVEKIKSETGSVPILLSRVLNQLEKTHKIPPEKSHELRSFLESKGLREETIVMIMNICPSTLDELQYLMELEEKTPDSNTLNEILSQITSYCGGSSSN